MTQRKPSGMGFESWVDRQIREATERGEFDDLPGAGKPLPPDGGPGDDLWWVRGYVEREGLSTEELLPEPLRLRKEMERLHESVGELPTEQAVRDAVSDLNQRIVAWLRAPSGPAVRLSRLNPDALVERWRTGRTGTTSDDAARGTGTAGSATADGATAVRPAWWRLFGRPPRSR